MEVEAVRKMVRMAMEEIVAGRVAKPFPRKTVQFNETETDFLNRMLGMKRMGTLEESTLRNLGMDMEV